MTHGAPERRAVHLAFDEIVLRAELDGAQPEFVVVLSGQDDDRRAWRRHPDPTDHIEPDRVREREIGQNDFHRAVVEDLDRFRHESGDPDDRVVVEVRHLARDLVCVVALVLQNQDAALRHLLNGVRTEFERTTERGEQAEFVPGLGHDLGDKAPEILHPFLVDFRESCDDNERGVVLAAAQVLDDRVPIHARHPQVRDHDGVRMLLTEVNGLRAGVGDVHREPALADRIRKQLADVAGRRRRTGPVAASSKDRTWGRLRS